MNTLQKWDRKGILKAHRSPINRRYSIYDQYLPYRGVVAQEQGFTIVSTRASQELVRDLIAIVTVLSARLHGLRSYREVLKEAALQKELG